MAIIDQFVVEGGIYYHDFCLDNDSNLLCDFDGQPLILYNRHGEAEDVRGKDKELLKATMERVGTRIGSFRINGNDNWEFHFEDGRIIEGYDSRGGESLLKTEVTVSKAIIPEWFPLPEGNEPAEPLDIGSRGTFGGTFTIID